MFIRQCKRCSIIYKSLSKYSMVCKDCCTGQKGHGTWKRKVKKPIKNNKKVYKAVFK